MREFVSVRCALAAAVLASACNFSPAKTCSKDADCPGASCDVKLGACVAPPPAPTGCSPECQDWEECVENQCVVRTAAVVILSPGENSFFSGPSMQVEAMIAWPENEAAPPVSSSLRYALTPVGSGDIVEGVLDAQPGGTFVATVPLGAEGGYLLEVGWLEAGLKSAARSVTVDRTAPPFELLLAPPTTPAFDGGTVRYADPEPGWGEAYKRGEKAVLRVRSADTNLDTNSVQITVGGGAPLSVANWFVCDLLVCGELTVDFSQGEMNAFRGEVSINVTGNDLAGNSGAASKAVKVSRWNWSRTVSSASALTAPAVGGSGTVYVGSLNPADGLVAVNPDGTQKWKQPLGAVTAPPSVAPLASGGEIVFGAAKGSVLEVFALNSADGMPRHKCDFGAAPTSEAALATMETTYATENVVSGVAVVNQPGTPRLAAIRPDASLTSDKCMTVLSGGGADASGNVVASAGKVFFGDTAGNVQGFEFGAAGWAALPNWPVAVVTRGLSWVASSLIGNGGPGQGGVFSIPVTGGPPAWEFPPSGAVVPAWSPTIGAGNVVAFGNINGQLQLVPVDATSGMSATAAGEIKAAPVWGADNRLYTLAANGTLQAWSSALTAQWQLAGLGISVLASPTLDCARESNGTKRAGPGVLYVASDQGTLYSFLVDSRGVSTTAPWPKYQRDPRNSGNAGTDLAEFACPQ